MTQVAVGHDRTKSNLPVDVTSFCRVMYIDMAGKQPITAQPTAMLTKFNSYVYLGLLQDKLKMWLSIGGCNIFQHDGAPCHQAKLGL